jgi:DNA-binding MarR family transcriptional regulator
VERRRDARDRRNHVLHLTAAGDKIMAGVRALRPAHERELTAGLDDEQAAQLEKLLGSIADHQELAAGVHPGYRR